MRKTKILILLILLIVLFSFSWETLAFLNSKTLYYNGNTNKFSYINTNNTELFDSFKELMPGDTAEESVLFKGTNIKEGSTLYIEVKDDEILDFVNVEVYEDENLVTSNPTNETILKALNKNEEFEIKLKLKVDENVGNEIENLEKKLNISFVIKNPNGDVISPKTGDNSRLLINLIIMVISLAGIIYTIFYKRNHEKEN